MSSTIHIFMIKSFKKFFLVETPYKELESNVLSFKPKTKKRQKAVKPLAVSDLKINAARGVKTLRFIGTVSSSKGGTYKTTIQFNDIDFNSSEFTFEDQNNERYSIKKIDLNKNDVMLRCQCLDFYFRFGFYNWQDKSIFGNKPKKYVRKTDYWPSVNPDKVPGFCKHIIKMLKDIQSQGFIK